MDIPPPQDHAGPAHPPGPAPQLPPQMFTTAASLLDLTDKKLTVVLRDGRKVVGVLRSWDQFGNLVLTESSERIFSTPSAALYADIPRGVYLVRGENVLLMGEVDLDREEAVPEPWRRGEAAEVFALQKGEEARRKKGDEVARRRLKMEGFEGESKGETVL